MKSTFLKIVAIATLLVFSGCGGGNSNNSGSAGTPQSAVIGSLEYVPSAKINSMIVTGNSSTLSTENETPDGVLTYTFTTSPIIVSTMATERSTVEAEGPEEQQDALSQELENLIYIATWPDLIKAFGTDAARGASHYINYGERELRGSPVPFSVDDYLEKNADVASQCASSLTGGSVEICAVRHFITIGFNEGRHWSDLIALSYIASYSDLRTAYGADPDAGRKHYLEVGRATGRNSFYNIVNWLNQNPSTASYFDGEFEGALGWFIQNGSVPFSTSNTYIITNGKGLCLAPLDGNVAVNGSRIGAVLCNNVPSQKWILGDDSMIRNSTNPTRCLESDGKTLVAGRKVQVWNCHGDVNQVWDLLSSRYLKVKNIDASTCVGMVNQATAAGASSHLARCKADDQSQRWHIKIAS